MANHRETGAEGPKLCRFLVAFAGTLTACSALAGCSLAGGAGSTLGQGAQASAPSAPSPTATAVFVAPPVLAPEATSSSPTPTACAGDCSTDEGGPGITLTPTASTGLPGYGVLATPWPGADAQGVITWGPGEFTVAPPVYPPTSVPTAVATCPWDATDAAWAQDTMTADASDDLETYNLLLSGRGFTIPGWGQDSETTANIQTYHQAEENWSQIATWINGACFPVVDVGSQITRAADGTPITAAEAAQAITWCEAGAASHPGSDSWSVAWYDSYQYIAAMFQELPG